MQQNSKLKAQLIAKWQDITRAAAGEFSISPDCAKDLFSSFIEAANKMEQESLLNDAASLGQSYDNVWRLVRVMVAAAEEAGSSYLSEGTFRAAKQALCPLWPFCQDP